MESKFKKILLQSTVFTCLSSGVNVTMALEGDRETTATAEYHSHHAENFVNVADTNPAMAAIKKQQQAHRETIMADVNLMLGAITDTTVQGNLDNLKNMIAAALTADADAINDIEDKHDAKKTATVDTAETLLEKADQYNTAKDKGSIPLDIQHYRLAYFLMLKLQPWLADNYKNDPDEVDTLLKNHIPTYYPEWTDQKILIKGLKVKLDNTAKPDAEEPKIKFSTAQTKIPAGTKVYSYIDGKGIEVDDSTYTISLSVVGSDATISGLKDYGIYYVEVDGVKQYFAVNSTKENEIIYSPDGIVKFTTVINKGLRTAAVENKDFRPKLRLLRNENVLDTDTFKVRLEGDTTWKKLDDFETNEFLRSDHKLEFSGLNAGTYTFEAAASDEVVVKPLKSDGEGIKIDRKTGSGTGKDSFVVLASIVEFTATAKDKTYNAKKAADITWWSAEANNGIKFKSTEDTGFAPAFFLRGAFEDAEVGKAKTVNGTVAFRLGAYTKAFKENYQIQPTFTTKANINAVVAAGTGTGGGGTTTTTTPGLAFSAIIPNTGSPYLKATGTASNIPAGTYSVSIISNSNEDGAGTIVVDANGNYKVSLSGLTFAAGRESVTVTITTAGTYAGTSFTFYSPVITAAFTTASGGTGSVEFTVGEAFNGITPTFVEGGDVTGYTGGTSIANGKVTRGYTTATLGSITARQKIIIEGTNFTFSEETTSTLGINNFILNGYQPNDPIAASVVTISDQSQLVPNGGSVTNVVVHDNMKDENIDFNSVDDFDGFAFIIHLADGVTLENETTITFEYMGQEYTVSYTPQ